jgi:hypothetical protein
MTPEAMFGVIFIVGAWLVLQGWILPKLGVAT